MHRHFLLLLILPFSLAAVAQTNFKRNTVYGEFLGNGIFASVNYERQLTKKPGLGVRLGVGHHSGDEVFRLSIPVALNYLFQLHNDKAFLDASIGATWAQADGLRKSGDPRNEEERIINFVPGIGYRRQTRQNIMWRVSFAPIINKYRSFPWIGLSVGMCF